MPTKYYEEPSSINYKSIAIGIILLVPIGAVLGYCYQLLIHAIGFVYFNMVVAIGLGLLLGFVVQLVGTWAKARGKTTRNILLICAILLVTFFQWITHLATVVFSGFPSILEFFNAFQWVLTKPVDVIGLIGEIYAYGTWELGSYGIIKGWTLVLVWIGEILIITIPALNIFKAFDVIPFSEKYEKWYATYALQKEFEAFASKNVLEEKLDKGVIETLSNLDYGSSVKYSKVYLCYIEGEADQYLSVERVFVSLRGKTNYIRLISNYRIDSAVARAILHQFESKKIMFRF